MQFAVPLTDLCAICHVNPIKYTCPRDGIHTCSLPCVKRHKQWAQCSGVRDPAEYRKRSELATAASIDKDFNFITKVERTLSRADDAVADRGIDLVPATLRPNDARPKFELEAEARGIKIIKAPKGLSRSKQNKTQWGGQPKCIVWTIEWILPDGRKSVSAGPENKSVQDLFDAASSNRRTARKRKRLSVTGEKEGKLDAVDTNMSPSRSQAQPMGNITLESLDSQQGNSDTGAILDDRSASHRLYFYLHRPNTESRFKCLIPLLPTASLQDSLNDKTLLEFPTIHVRDEAPDQLPPPFISEDEYTQRHGVDIPINVTIPTDAMAASSDVDLEEGEIAASGSIDEKKVFEVLAQDLGG